MFLIFGLFFFTVSVWFLRSVLMFIVAGLTLLLDMRYVMYIFLAFDGLQKKLGREKKYSSPT